MRAVKLSFLLFFITNFLFAQYNWSPIGPGAGSDLKSIAIHPEDPDIVYIGGDIEGIFKTTDGGQSWKIMNSNLATEYSMPDIYWVQEIVFDPGDATYNTIFSCTVFGLYKSINGGESWELIYPKNPTIEEDFVAASYLAIDPDDNQKMWLGTGTSYSIENGPGSVFYSEDGGATWTEHNLITGGGVINGIFIDKNSAADNRTIYVSTNAGLFKSSNNGTSWEKKVTGLPHENLRRLVGTYDGSELILYLTTVTTGTVGNSASVKGGVFKSTDDAENWADITDNLLLYQEEDGLFYFYWKVTVDPTNPNIVYTATVRGWPDEGLAGWNDWGIFKSTTGGGSWVKINNNLDEGWLSPPFYEEENAFILEVAPSDPNTIYWGVDWMMKTTDGGANWSQIYSVKNGDYWQTTGLELMVADGMAFDPANANTFYIAYDDFGLMRTDDGGSSFKMLDEKQDPYEGPDAVKDVCIDPANGDLYISRYDGLADAANSNYTVGGVWKSSDKGETVTKISTNLPEGRPHLVLDKNSGSAGSRTLYCAVYGSGIYKTTNSGAAWTEITTGLGTDAAKVWEICIDPTDSDILFAGTNMMGAGGAIYKSTDAGANWNKIDVFPAYDVMKIYIEPNTGDVYVGATDSFDYNTEGGLYRSKDQGNTWEKIFDDSRIADVTVAGDPAKIYCVSQAWYLWNAELKPGVYSSDADNINWENLTGNLGHTFFRLIKVNPHNNDEIFIGTDGAGVWKLDLGTTSVENKLQVPTEYKLCQNYPNPFNPVTTIEFNLPVSGMVKIIVYNLLGEKISTIADSYYNPGKYEVEFDASELNSGIYFYKMIAENFSKTMKMVLIK